MTSDKSPSWNQLEGQAGMDDEGSPFRGIVIGLLISVLLWLAVFEAWHGMQVLWRAVASLLHSGWSAR